LALSSGIRRCFACNTASVQPISHQKCDVHNNAISCHRSHEEWGRACSAAASNAFAVSLVSLGFCACGFVQAKPVNSFLSPHIINQTVQSAQRTRTVYSHLLLTSFLLIAIAQSTSCPNKLVYSLRDTCSQRVHHTVRNPSQPYRRCSYVCSTARRRRCAPFIARTGVPSTARQHQPAALPSTPCWAPSASSVWRGAKPTARTSAGSRRRAEIWRGRSAAGRLTPTSGDSTAARRRHVCGRWRRRGPIAGLAAG